MTEVVSSVKRVTDIVTEITAASREQNSGIEQINEAIVQMDQVTQQNAVLVEQAAAAAASLQDQAAKLEGTVDVFKIIGMASRQAPVPALAKNKVAAVSPRPAAKPASRSIPEPRPRLATEPAGDDWEQF